MKRTLVAGVLLLCFATTLVPTGAALKCTDRLADLYTTGNCLRAGFLDGNIGCLHIAESHGEEGPVGSVGPWEEMATWWGVYVYIEGGPEPEDDFGAFIGIRKDCLS